MKKLIISLLAAALLFTACIISVRTNKEKSSIINVKPHYSTPWKWRPLKAEELFEFTKLYTDEYAELFEKNNLSQDFEIQYACIRENEIYIYTVNNGLLRFEFSDNMWQLQKNFTGGYTGNLDSVNDEMEHRLTGDELYELYLELNNTEKLYDGYQSGNYYILYSYDYVYYVKREKEEYIIVYRGNSDWAETHNIYTDEGLMPEMQYTVNYNCLPNDESKGNAYNAAIDAYNEFLAQKAEENLEWVNSIEYVFGVPVPFVYLKDLNDDGILEMILYSEAVGGTIYPPNIYTYRDDKIIALVGPMSNGMHGGVYMLENGIYFSNHISVGVTTYFVTYNKDGTQTIEEFFTDTIEVFKYQRYTVDSMEEWRDNIEDYYILEGKQHYDDMYAPYIGVKEHPMDLGERYCPFNADTTYNYSPYVTEELKQNG